MNSIKITGTLLMFSCVIFDCQTLYKEVTRLLVVTYSFFKTH